MPDRLPDPHILLADDNEENRVMLKRRLQRRGLRVAGVGNGREAVELTLQLSPRLILMDLEMPEMSGFTALEKLREAGVRVPVFALTAHAIQDIGRQCVAAGFDGFITKPIDFSGLLAQIADAGLPLDADGFLVAAPRRSAGGGRGS